MKHNYLYPKILLSGLMTCGVLLIFGLPGVLAEASARLSLRETQRDLGRIPRDRRIVVKFEFRNLGDADLLLYRVKGSCDCISARAPAESRFAPGKGGEIEVTVDTEGVFGRQRKTVLIESNDPLQPRAELEILFEAEAPDAPCLSIPERVITLGRIEPENTEALSFDFIYANLGRRALEVKFDGLPAGVSISGELASPLAPGSSALLRGLWRAPRDARGLIETSLSLSSNDPKESQVPLKIRAWGGGSAKPVLEARRWRFVAAAGESQTAVWLVPKIEEPKTLKIPSFLVLEGLAPRGDGLCEMKLGLGAPAGGHGTIFWSGVLESPSWTLGLEILGIWGDPVNEPLSLEIRGDSGESKARPVDAGVFKEGMSQRPLRLKNSGRAVIAGPLRLRAGELEMRAGFSSLEPGAETEGVLEVSIPPRVAGGFEARRQELRGAGLAIEIHYKILGAAQPELELSQSLLDFGAVPSGALRKSQITLRNSGLAPLEIQRLIAVGAGPGPGLELPVLAPQSLAPQASLTLPLSFTAGSEMGLVCGELMLRSSDPRGSRSIPYSAWVEPPPGAKLLRISYESDRAGELEPCGCGGVEQVGGFPRLVSAHRRLAAGSFFLFAGGLLDAKKTGESEDYRDRRRSLIFQQLQGLGLGAWTLAPSDLGAGVEALRALQARPQAPALVSANLAGELRDLVQSAVVLRSPDQALIISGVTDPGLLSAASRQRFNVSEPAAALRAAFKKVDPKRSLGPRVVLASCGTERARELCEELRGAADLVIVGLAEAPFEDPRRIAGVLMVANAERGKRLAVVDIASDPSSSEVLAWSGFHERLSARWADEPSISAALKAWRRELASLPPHSTPSREGEPRYLGEKSCRRCHEPESRLWEQSRHAHAMASLRASESRFDPSCTVCHSVGQGEASGFQRLDLSPELAEVQCEACHGPGERHAANPPDGMGGGQRMASLGLESCRRCHNPEHSPKFDAARYWRRIGHGHKALIRLWDRDGDGALSDEELEIYEAFRRDHSGSKPEDD